MPPEQNNQNVNPSVPQQNPVQDQSQPVQPTARKDPFKNFRRAGVTGIIFSALATLVVAIVAVGGNYEFLINLPFIAAIMYFSTSFLLDKDAGKVLKSAKITSVLLVVFLIISLLSGGGAGVLILLLIFFMLKGVSDLYNAGLSTSKALLKASAK